MTKKTIPNEAYRFASPASIEEEGTKTRFSGIAYTGDILSHPFWGEVAFELSSITPPQKLPMLIGHDRDKNAGFSESVSVGDNVQVSGILLSNKHGSRIKQDADEGFPWQMSVHIDSQNIEEVGKGETCNGRTFTKNGVIFKDSTFREISFTPTGVDSGTSSKIFSFTYADMGNKPNDNQFEKGQSPEKKEGSSMSMTREEAATLQAENEGLKARFEALDEKYNKFAAKVEADERAAHAVEVDKLFSDIGKTPSDAEKAAFQGMSKEQFSHAASMLRAANHQASRSHLFGEKHITPIVGGDSIDKEMKAALDALQGA